MKPGNRRQQPQRCQLLQNTTFWEMRDAQRLFSQEAFSTNKGVAAMGVVVQKYGGTCLATPEHREWCAQWVGNLARREQVVVVVSAMGRRGDPYATDTLLELVGPGGSPRDRDLLVACGEIIAAVVLSACINRCQVPSTALTGAQAGITTDARHGDARVLIIDPQPLRQVLAQGAVPVVAGFQGTAACGDITTLGRGGSDITAAAIGAALGAERVELYKDVPGVLDEYGQVYAHLTYTQALGLARAGAKVLHPLAVETARTAAVPLWVRPVGDAAGLGTWIDDGKGREERRVQIV